MKEYVPQLRISAYDPVCVASNLGDTIIGVLFDKKGTEIKAAITVRTELIDKKIGEYRSVVDKIEVFLTEKRTVLKELDLYYQARVDERKAALRPHQRQIQDTMKKCDDVAYDFDRGTVKKLSEKAVVFEGGFDEFKSNFDELDEFLRKENERVLGVDGLQGPQGSTGIQGHTGIQGLREPVRGAGFGDKVSELYHPQLSTDFLDKPGSTGCTGSTGSAGYSGDRHDDEIYEPITEEEEMAAARMETLRNLLQKYVNKIETLKHAIKVLVEEKRRLSLIARHIDNDRNYKLDLNKLSAFGFEDLEVV